MSKKLTRHDLLRIARDPHWRDKFSVALTEEEHTQVELFSRYQTVNGLPLGDAPRAWRERAVAIAKSGRSVSKALRELVASLTFDSWAMAAPVGVRSTATRDERRMRFETENIVFDFRAEQREKIWDFIASIINGPLADADTVLIVGGKSLHADDTGVFQWSAARLPTKLKLRIEDTSIEMPKIQWK